MRLTQLAPLAALLVFALSAGLAVPASAEEGLWTFDAFPAALVERNLSVRLEPGWLDRVRAGSVRLTSGCSGAAVSPRGMVVTNQHCIIACAQSLSDPAHDRLAGGFGVAAEESPRRCPGLQAEILVGIADITDTVFKRSAGKQGDDYVRARELVLYQAEHDACAGDRRYRCQVISFFGGGQFKLYRYRRYDDVRLAFAPEFPVAFFGGDAENFSFPRYDLDVAVLRLYDHAAPARLRSWLNWSARAPMAGEPVFVSGSPGGTDRALTVSQLETLRDIVNPDALAAGETLRRRLALRAAEGAEQHRLAAERLFTTENDLKVLRGQQAVLNGPGFIASRLAEEIALKASVKADPRLTAGLGDPWADLEALRRVYRIQYPLWRQLEAGAGGGSRLFWYARTLVRAAAERPQPSAGRLPEFSDARLALLQKTLLDDQPVDPELEALDLELWLSAARAVLGAGDPATAILLRGAEPEALAARLARETRLGDPAVRATLWRGGAAAIMASNDPLIAYVARTDPLARAARRVWENEVIGPTDEAALRIARARFAVNGASVYPDATFSPRLSYGRVEGWRDGSTIVPPSTDLAGLFGHATNVEPRRLPARWLAAQGALNTSTVLNFVTTNDIVGGNSGSPVVDAAGDVIGLAFDGNQGAIAGDFAYDPVANRTVAVSAAAITEALAKVYGRADLIRELTRR